MIDFMTVSGFSTTQNKINVYLLPYFVLAKICALNTIQYSMAMNTKSLKFIEYICI